MKNYLVPFLGTALFLIACGDEVTNISENGGADTVTSFKDLGKCEKSTIGKFIYVSDSVKVYACTDDGWVAVTGTAVNGKNGSNGSDGEKGDKGDKGDDGDSCEGVQNKDGSVTIKCGGKKIGTISNGDDGAQGPAGESCEGVQNDDGSVTISCGGKEVGTITNGNDGAQGPAGESCKGVKNENGSVTIKCGGKEIGTISNGEDGDPGAPGTSCEGVQNENGSVTIKCGGKEIGTISNGNDGENGTSCKIASDKDGVVQLQCGEGENATTTTLYKAMCGTQPYDPETSLCKEGQVYFKCGNDTYDPKKEFCYENQKYDFCENDEYNPSEKFCVNNKLYDLCNGKKYDVSKQFCANNGKPENLCDGEEYDVSIYFCYSDVPVERCGGNEYDLTKEFCSGGEKYNLCGGQKYDVSEKFCYDGKTYGLCGGVDYNPITHECENGTSVSFEAACGDVKYNKKNSFCAEFENKKTHEKTYQVYKFVKIAPEGINYAKTWMAENLKYVTKDSYCYGGQQSCDSYGRLYTWEAAKEACPVGWHLPTQREWETLLAAVKGENGAGYALKSKTDWDGDDTYHFTALPGGVGENGQYSLIGILANFWTATEAESGEKAIYVSLESKVDTWGEGASSVNNLFSVRCLKGNPRN